MSSRPVVLRTNSFVVSIVFCSVLWLLFQLTVSASESVTLAWNPSADPSVAGFKIYYGTASHDYSNVVLVGNTNSVTITGLEPGITYYFAATSYDQAGDESDLSNEASYTVPLPLPKLNAAAFANGQFGFDVSGTAGRLYAVQASTNLIDWVSIQTNAAPFNFVDVDAGRFQKRFYRTMELAAIEAALLSTPVLTTSADSTSSTNSTSSQFSFNVSGSAGWKYVVLASTNLVDWTPVETNAAPFTFVDSHTTGYQKRFFRAVSLTP